MSDSSSTAYVLRELAERLHREASALEEAAEILDTLRAAKYHEEEIKSARERAAGWMSRK